MKLDENLNIQGCDANFNVINIASINSSVILTNTVNVLTSSFHNIDGDMVVSDIDPERTDSDLDSLFACGVDTIPPTLVTEAWIPDDTTGTEIVDGGVVNLEDIDESDLIIEEEDQEETPSESDKQDEKSEGEEKEEELKGSIELPDIDL